MMISSSNTTPGADSARRQLPDVRGYARSCPDADLHLEENRARTGAVGASWLPIVDAMVHARATGVERRAGRRGEGRRRRRRGSDLVTTATVYAAAMLTTVGFVIGSVVDSVLGVDGRDADDRRR